jgi:hypothetical protein
MASVLARSSRPASTSRLTRLGAFMQQELREVIPPTLFFFVGFNLILLTKRLFLAEYLIAYAGFLIATTGALVVGKVVLIADNLPLLRRFDYAPLAYPILFKTVVYSVLVLLARLLELAAHYIASGGAAGQGQFIQHMLGTFSWARFTAIHLWIFVLFLIYVTASEFNALFGDGELTKILFRRRSSQLKMTRRARIRLLIQLSRLTNTHSVEEIANPESDVHGELVIILQRLALDGRVAHGETSASNRDHRQ